MLHPFQLLAFDLDGTLLDTESVSVPDLIQFLNQEYQVPITVNHWFAGGYHGLAGSALFSRLHAEYGILPDPVEFRQKREARLASLFAHGIPEAPGITQLLSKLSLQPTPLCIVSNASPHRIQLSLSNARPPLPAAATRHIFSSIQPGLRPKPAPDVYLHAAHSMGVSPSRCLAFEDSFNGAQAARDAGFTVIGYLGLARHPQQESTAMRSLGIQEFLYHWQDFPTLYTRLQQGA